MWKMMQLLQILPALWSLWHGWYKGAVASPAPSKTTDLGFCGSTVTLDEEMQQQSITADWIWIFGLATCHLVILE